MPRFMSCYGKRLWTLGFTPDSGPLQPPLNSVWFKINIFREPAPPAAAPESTIIFSALVTSFRDSGLVGTCGELSLAPLGLIQQRALGQSANSSFSFPNFHT